MPLAAPVAAPQADDDRALDRLTTPNGTAAF